MPEEGLRLVAKAPQSRPLVLLTSSWLEKEQPEAKSRRLARFFRMGHTPGRMALAPPQRSLEFPFTLDLRQH